MKAKYLILMIVPLLMAACHEPEYVAPTANRQGLTSLSAIITEGKYAEKELGRLVVTDQEADHFEIPIPFYYPEASNDETLIYMMNLRIQAELQPNWKITPRLGVIDLTKETVFTLTDPFGNSRQIYITGKREKSSNCKLLSIMVDEVKTSGVIYEADDKILIPYLDDISSVHIVAQVAPHATITSVNGKAFNENTKYNMNTGATITVTAHNGTSSKTYNVEQGIPTLMGQGLRTESVALLCNVDPVTMVGLPGYNDKCFVSLAGIDTKILVGLGLGRAPFVIDAFTGSKIGEMVLGGASAECITNDDAGHILLCDYAPTMMDFVKEDGSAVPILESQTVNIWTTDSPDTAPTLFHTFTNPLGFPIGHRMKVVGDITGDAVIVFTAEGIANYSLTSAICYIPIRDGVISDQIKTYDFAGLGPGWGTAPVNIATVVPASVDPEKDGWFLDYYEGNVDPSVPHGGEDCYILHYVSGKGKDSRVELMGNWAINPNCLAVRSFNGGRFMALFGVSHFPQWDKRPRLHFFEVTEPTAATPILKNDDIAIYQKGAANADFGASGDVAIVSSSDGYRLYVYYYDHHTQAIGAYVADCFEI